MNDTKLMDFVLDFCEQCEKATSVECVNKCNPDKCSKLRNALSEEIAARDKQDKICYECERKCDCENFLYGKSGCSKDNVVHISSINQNQQEENTVDMFAMKKHIQANLLKARQEMVEENTLTQFAMIGVIDALFYIMENIGQNIVYGINTGIGAVSKKDNTDAAKRNKELYENMPVCKSTGNYCISCNPGPCEHRKG